MTNANVEQTVASVDGHTLTLKYKDGGGKDHRRRRPPSSPMCRVTKASSAGSQDFHRRREQATGWNTTGATREFPGKDALRRRCTAVAKNGSAVGEQRRENDQRGERAVVARCRI